MGRNMKKIIGFLIFVIILLNAASLQAQNTPSQISDEQAHEIVLTGTPDDVKKLIQSGYDVNKVYQCNTLLNVAVKSAVYSRNANKHPTYALEKIKLLTKAGANINKVSCIGISMPALHWAVALPSLIPDMERDVNIAIDEKIKNKIGECNFPGIVSKPCGEITSEEREEIRIAIKGAMQLAYRKFIPYFMEIIDFLVKSGADINLKAGTFETSPLHLAAANPQEITLEPLKYLIQKGADINIQDSDGNTALFWAYSVENDRIVNELIKAGADENIKNAEGAFYYDVKSVKQRILLDQRGDIEIETYE